MLIASGQEWLRNSVIIPQVALLREVGHEMQPSISAGQKPTIEVVALSCSFIPANARGMEAACLLICWDTKQMQESKCRVAFQLLQRLPLADSQTLTAQPPDLKLPSLLPENAVLALLLCSIALPYCKACWQAQKYRKPARNIA